MVSKRLLFIVVGVLLLGGVGFALAAATTGTVSVCATTPAQTIKANGKLVGTIPGVSACKTVTYTVPTATVTVTTPGTTTTPTTTTIPTTTTTPTTTSGPPTGGQVFLTSSGSDVTCVRGNPALPCATPAGAWAVAQSGDTIDVEDGTYTTGCVLNGDKTAMTTFVGNGGGVEFVCDMTLNGADAGFQNLGMYQFDDEANHISFQNVNLTCVNAAPYTLYTPGNKCSTAWNISGSNFTWNGGSWGPLYESDSPCNGNAPQGATLGWNGNPQNVTISNVYAHDVSIGCSAQHSELMRIDGGDNLTLDGVFMHGCGNSACVFVSNESGLNPQFTIKNTVCDGTGLGGDCMDVDFDGSQGSQILLENDTFLGGIAQNDGNSYSSGEWVIANTIWYGANGCMPGPTYHNDAPYQPSGGGTTDNFGGNQIGVGQGSDNPGTPSSWLACGSNCAAGGIGLDYSVKAGSPLIGAGSAAYMPAFDYAGNPRPNPAHPSAPDVGAYENR